MLLVITPDPAPWWGAPLIAACALLLGAALTLAGSQWRANADRKRTDQRRWDELVLETAVQVETICAEMVRINMYGWPQYIEDSQERMSRYTELINQLNRDLARFRLVASVQLKETNINLIAAATEAFLRKEETSLSKFSAAREAFVEAVRSELKSN